MPKQVLTATALALLIGVSTFTLNVAAAQNGGEARSNNRETKKALDDKHLTPIRPIRRVGDDSWPAAKNQPTTRETSGQASSDKKQDTAQNTSKPDTKQSQDQNLGNQAPPPDKPQDAAQQKQDSAGQDTARQDNKQAGQKPDATKQAQEPASQQNDRRRDTAQNKNGQNNNEQKSTETGGRTEQKTAGQNDQKNDNGEKNDKGFASIRLGTDESGRVAVNDAQEKQITKVIRKQHVDTVNVKVSVGSVAPANVKLVAVSSDFVDIMPQFRGYSFFATREEIVIVEPSTRKVVALIPVSLTATASRPGEERDVGAGRRRTETRTTSRTRERDVTVGRAAQVDDVPSREEILAAPVVRSPSGTAVTRTYRSYQYEEPADVVIIERRRPRFFGFW